MMHKQDGRKRILSEADLAEIDYSLIEEYNFEDTPESLRPQILGGYLSWCYAEAYQKEFRKSRKNLSQAQYAKKTLHVNPMNFSGYKNGERTPTGENLDKVASALGGVVYDILGLARKMPEDPILVEIVNQWHSLSKSEQLEVLDQVNSFLSINPNSVTTSITA